MKKITVLAIAFIVLLTVGVLIIFNQNKFNKETPLEICNGSRLNAIDERQKNYIKINGEEIEIFCTFKSKEKSLENIKKEAKNALSIMKEEYQLAEFSFDSWRNYKDNTENFIGKIYDNEYLENILDEGLLLRHFFDIYENFDLNEEIKEYIKDAREKKIVLTNDETFINMLPYHSKLAKEYRKYHKN